MAENIKSARRLGRTLRFMGALWDLNHSLEVASMRLLKTAEITAQQRFLIRITNKLGPISAGGLARVLHVHPGTLSVSLSRLERRGLIKRKRDLKDARRIWISVTPRGRKLDESIPRYVERAVAKTLRKGTAREAERLLQALARLSEEVRIQST